MFLKVFVDTAMRIDSPPLHGCFHASVLELSSCDPEHIHYLALHRKNFLLISVLNDIAREFYYNSMYGNSKVSPVFIFL